MEAEYCRDKILHTGFDIPKESYGQVNVNSLINASEFTDSEFSCDCGSYIGRDLLGQICPHCRSEITLRSLNFSKTGWLDIYPHHVITPVYYNILKRVLGNNFLRFILGDYKNTKPVDYTDEEEENKEEQKEEPKKRKGRVSADDIKNIIQKIPKNKLQYQGIGHDGFYDIFEEIVLSCKTKNNVEDIEMILGEKSLVFTSKIPVYSTAFRPVSKTSESFFYPKINRFYAQMCAVTCSLDDMYLKEEQINALNCFQKYWIEAADHLISNEMAEKSGLVRSEIVGGTFEFSSRGVIILDTTLAADQIDLPFPMLMTLMKFKVTHRLHTRYNLTLEQAYLMVNNNQCPEIVDEILQELVDEGIWLMMIREPTNNIASNCLVKVRAFKHDDDTISVSEPVLAGLNADFDGDQLNLFVIPNELLKYWWQFHLSCFVNPVKDEIQIRTKEWSAVCTALITS
jgi:DNA-directed RNA polymerase beta' subunit